MDVEGVERPQRRPLSLRRQPIFLGTAGLILLLWISASGFFYFQRQDLLEDARQDAGHIALAVDFQLTGTLDRVDQALLFLKRRYEADPESFNIERTLPNVPADAPVRPQMSLVDARGLLIDSTEPSASARTTDVSGLEYFKAHRDIDTGTPFIGAPIAGKLADRWLIPVSRRLNRPDGSFGGVIAATLDPFDLARIYSGMDLRPGGSVAVFGVDGVIRVRTGLDPERMGSALAVSLASSPVFADPSPVKFYALPSALDGVERLYAARRLDRYPLYVTVGLSR